MHVVWLGFGNDGEDIVGYAKPKDEEKFLALLDSDSGDEVVHKKIDGWTVFASTTALIDKFEAARANGDTLAGVSSFEDAIERQPEDAAVRGWVSGEAIQAEIDKQASAAPSTEAYQEFTKSFGKLESVSFAAAAEDDGVKAEAAYTADGGPEADSFSASLDDKLPAAALVYVSFGNLEDYFNEALESANKSVPSFKTQRAQIEQALGFSLKMDLLPLFSREGAVAVYHASELAPAVTFMLDVEGKEDDAKNVVTRLGALLQLGGQGQVKKLTVDGVEVSQSPSPGNRTSSSSRCRTRR